ncbi:hypothetical protein [Winogradskya humida]|uniref:hypothetical protein n=1 Tax=Winogradskya humida TaxID=113566 RepID=UPI001944F776|nr:hypothetical protein [Actinoplanes humidus]
MVRYPDLPTKQARLESAGLSGALERLTVGKDKDCSDEAALAELREITTDRHVVGHVLGSFVVQLERNFGYDWTRAVRLLRELGADEDQAARVAAWQRERYARNGGLLP